MRAAAAALVLLAGCSSSAKLPKELASVAPWPEADTLFHREPRWLGGDGAFSLDIGRDRILWLFHDSFIATTAAHVRSESTMVRNSIAIQTGRDPTRANMAFTWREDQTGPKSFFAEEGDRWFWPAHGIRVDQAVIIFLNRVRAAEGGLGFASDGWTTVYIPNPDDDPLDWTLTPLTPPPVQATIVVGAALARDGDKIRVFGFADPGDHEAYLFDWPLDAAAGGDMSKLVRVKDEPVFSPGASEFSVHRDPILQKWVEVQTIGFGAADLAFRTADDPSGPWSELQKIYHPPESDREGTLVYAGKAHPHLVGADLTATYAANAFDFATLVNDPTLYYPRFVKISLQTR